MIWLFKYFANRRINKLLVRLADLSAQLNELERQEKLTQNSYPFRSTRTMGEHAEVIEKLRQLGWEKP